MLCVFLKKLQDIVDGLLIFILRVYQRFSAGC